MRHLFLLMLISVTLFSCRRNNSSSANQLASDLTGNWRMVLVKDNTANIVTAKPSAITGNVDITFLFTTSAAGIINGRTPTNGLTAEFALGLNRSLSIPTLSVSQVSETSWGLSFLDNINRAEDFIFDTDGRLNINTSPNKTLTFTRR